MLTVLPDLTCWHRFVEWRKNRVREPTQDGRKLHRCRKRLKIERTIAWLHNFKRLVSS